jgi:SAM-dependent methyltransferase
VEDLEAASLPYRQPEFYAAMTDGGAERTAGIITGLVHLYGPVGAFSVLDVGCGTGAVLEQLANTYRTAVGVDLLPGMVEIASAKRAHLDVRQGDMRNVRLGAVFEVVVCVGNALSYMLRDSDVSAAFATFAAHAVPGAVLIIQTLTEWPPLDKTKTSVVLAGGRPAKVTVAYRADPGDGALVMYRDWAFEDGDGGHDEIRRRVLSHDELGAFAGAAGFRPADWPALLTSQQMSVFVKESRL